MTAKQAARILVVDDNPDNIRIIARFLQPDYKVQVAMDGAAALELLDRTERADLVLLDVTMPGIDGFEVCRRIRANKSTADVPVLFLTAHDETECILQGFKCGGNDYVVKPFVAPVLLARVNMQLELLRSRRELKQTNEKLLKANDELLFMSHTDGLMKIANRRYFDKTLHKEWQRGIRSGHQLSLLIIDVDHFKRYNDHYGHLKGDDCLKQVAAVISSCVRRPSDLVARYGGEEIAVILPNTQPDGALKIAELIRTAILQAAIPHEASPVNPCLTISIGIAGVAPQIDITKELLIETADAALYQAKAGGRNCVMMLQIPVSTHI